MAVPKTIIVTSGEPAGIGPDLCVALAEREWPCELVIAGDRRVLGARARHLGKTLAIHDYKGRTTAGTRSVSIAHRTAPVAVTLGKSDAGNARYVLDLLDYAIDGCLRDEFAAMVTAPVQKSILNAEGFSFRGHTEYLAERTLAKLPVMMLVTQTSGAPLRVALATTHLPLAEVSRAITRDSLQNLIAILDRDLRTRFRLPAPRILVCGLNPHAGEAGYLGREEIDLIAPTLAELREQGFDVTGPVPADTAFTPHRLEHADVVLAMYHDQGLPVLKYAGFGHAVNVTLGLPIVRTSVDHGTAFDLAGTGNADPASLFAAIELAIEIVEAECNVEPDLR